MLRCRRIVTLPALAPIRAGLGPLAALVHWRVSGRHAHRPAAGRARAKSKENLMARCRAHPKTA
jgi:hypothetical protein